MYITDMDTHRFKRDFLEKLDGMGVFEDLMDLLPDVAFFVKDRESRFVMSNRRHCEVCHVGSELEIIGKTDYDFFPRDRADLYVTRDRQIMESGVPMVNVVSPAPEEEGSNHLIIGSKFALKDSGGNIIGVAGIHRAVDGMRATPKSFGPFSRAVQYIHDNYSESINTRKIALMVGMSHRQFNRRFRRFFNTSLCQYLMRVRVNAACRLLAETDYSITEIAEEVGFYDQSHFSKTFTRFMGISPLKYRKRHIPDSVVA
ncbi:MAG: helix-turn-helix domain-containing protein [Kiritimatiellia bacterium]